MFQVDVCRKQREDEWSTEYVTENLSDAVRQCKIFEQEETTSAVSLWTCNDVCTEMSNSLWLPS